MLQPDAVMENLQGAFANVSRACDGKVREFPGITACRHPSLTAEFNMAFLREERGTEKRTLDSVHKFFREVNATWCFVVPPDLIHIYGEVASCLRISQRRAIPEMTLSRGVKIPAPPEDLAITVVKTVEDLRIWSKTAHKGFGVGRRDALAPALNARGMSLLGGTSFIGWVSGKPVATSNSYVTGDVAGIYAVTTLPSARGHGYGEAMTWAAVKDGFSRGCGAISLQASPMGFPVYYRMGFRRTYEIEEWEVPAAKRVRAQQRSK